MIRCKIYPSLLPYASPAPYPTMPSAIVRDASVSAIIMILYVFCLSLSKLPFLFKYCQIRRLSHKNGPIRCLMIGVMIPIDVTRYEKDRNRDRTGMEPQAD